MAVSAKEAERSEKIIRGLLKLPDNRKCINCNSVGPQYVCTNFNTFVCITCSGVHREFSHRVKSVSMATFSKEEAASLQHGGNEKARQVFLRSWDASSKPFPDNSDHLGLREFIRSVYIERKYTGERPTVTGKPAVVPSKSHKPENSKESGRSYGSQDSKDRSSELSVGTNRYRHRPQNHGSPQTIPMSEILGPGMDRIVVKLNAEDTSSSATPVPNQRQRNQDSKGDPQTPQSERRPAEPTSLIDFSAESTPAPAPPLQNVNMDPYGLQGLAGLAGPPAPPPPPPPPPTTTTNESVLSWAQFDAPSAGTAVPPPNNMPTWPQGNAPVAGVQLGPAVVTNQPAANPWGSVQGTGYLTQVQQYSYAQPQPGSTFPFQTQSVAPSQPPAWDAFGSLASQPAASYTSGPLSTGSLTLPVHSVPSAQQEQPGVSSAPVSTNAFPTNFGPSSPSSTLNPSNPNPNKNPSPVSVSTGAAPTSFVGSPTSFGGAPSSFGGAPTSVGGSSSTGAGPASTGSAAGASVFPNSVESPAANGTASPQASSGAAVSAPGPAGGLSSIPPPTAPISRREIPEDFFSMANPYGQPSYAQQPAYVAPLGGYGAPNPPVGAPQAQYGHLQFTPLVTDIPGSMPAYAQPPKSLNPFEDDLSPTAVSGPAFSMATVQDSLPQPAVTGPYYDSPWGGPAGPASYPPAGTAPNQMNGPASASGSLYQPGMDVYGTGSNYGLPTQYTNSAYQGPGSSGAHQVPSNTGTGGYMPNNVGEGSYGQNITGVHGLTGTAGGNFGPSSTGGGAYGPGSSGRGGYGPSSTGGGGYGPPSTGVGYGPSSGGGGGYGPRSTGGGGGGPSSTGGGFGGDGVSFSGSGPLPLDAFGNYVALTGGQNPAAPSPPVHDPFAGLGLPFGSSSSSSASHRNDVKSNPFG